jgi:hypothetical protein
MPRYTSSLHRTSRSSFKYIPALDLQAAVTLLESQNDGRHKPTLFLFVYSWGYVKEEPRSMKFTSTCQRRLTHAHPSLQDSINDHLAQLFIPSILIMILMKKSLNSFLDG